MDVGKVCHNVHPFLHTDIPNVGKDGQEFIIRTEPPAEIPARADTIVRRIPGGELSKV